MTLKLTVTNHENLIHSTKLDFESNSIGVIDLSKDVPICKTYTSPDLMTLFWLLKPKENSDTRFWPTNLHKPLECTYEIFDTDEENVICQTFIHRQYIADGVERIVVKFEVKL